MKFCNYTQNNSEMYLAAVISLNIDVWMNAISRTDMSIYKVEGENEHTILLLGIPYWTTFPDMMVNPLISIPGDPSIMIRYHDIARSVDMFSKNAKAIREDIIELEINLL